MREKLTDLAPVLCCPRCRGSVAAVSDDADRLSCQACHIEFPTLGEVPWVYEDPTSALWEWRSAFAMKRHEFLLDEERCKSALQRPGLPETASRRLRATLQAKVEFRKALEELLQPMMADAPPDPGALTNLKSGGSVASSLFGYINNAYRDWGWPDTTENRESLALVLESIPSSSKPQKILILGAGAGRLAFDLHAALTPEITVACDINPFFFYLARRMLLGRTVHLPEFPLAPHGLANHAITRHLQAPKQAGKGLHLVLADAMDPPFVAGTFDLVLTPWFIDVVPQDGTTLFPKINHLLKAGGVWSNFGSVCFQSSEPERCYSREELFEHVAAAGFTVGASAQRTIDYLVSPASCQQRRETVLAFAAMKTAEAPPAPRFTALPDWLRDPTLPVPQTPELVEFMQVGMTQAAIVQMIDGTRSTEKLAEEVANAFRVPKAQAMPLVVRFLASVCVK